MAILSKRQRVEIDTYINVKPALDPYLEGEMLNALDTIDSLELLVSRLLQVWRVDTPEEVIRQAVIEHFAPWNYNPYEDKGYNDE